MTTEIKVPVLPESVADATVATWHVQVGDSVTRDQVLVEIETDKVVLEVPATSDGVITAINEAEGATVLGDQVIGVLSEGEATAAPAKTEAAAPAASSGGETLEILVPVLPESVADATVATWHAAEGDAVTRDQVLVEIETDKVVLEVPATADGVMGKIIHAEGDTVLGQQKIGELVAGASAVAAAPAQAPEADEASGDGIASPSVRRLMTEKGLSEADVKGTGKGGRITKEDAVKAVPSMGTPTGGNRGTSKSKMSMLRRKVAERLVSAKNETAMLTTFNEVDMSPIFSLRKQYKEEFKAKHGVSLGFMSFFTLACVRALEMYPAVNSMIEGKEMITYDYKDISIAVSGPKGLMVPVMRNTGNLSFRGVEDEVKRLALKARDGKITVDEMTGGTFTISNGGVFGSMLSTPIINPPQSAILGMHNIVERPVAIDGHVEIRPIMYVALSYDHRIIDGKESVGFLVAVKEALENPEELLMDNDVKRALEL